MKRFALLLALAACSDDPVGPPSTLEIPPTRYELGVEGTTTWEGYLLLSDSLYTLWIQREEYLISSRLDLSAPGVVQLLDLERVAAIGAFTVAGNQLPDRIELEATAVGKTYVGMRALLPATGGR